MNIKDARIGDLVVRYNSYHEIEFYKIKELTDDYVKFDELLCRCTLVCSEEFSYYINVHYKKLTKIVIGNYKTSKNEFYKDYKLYDKNEKYMVEVKLCEFLIDQNYSFLNDDEDDFSDDEINITGKE